MAKNEGTLKSIKLLIPCLCNIITLSNLKGKVIMKTTAMSEAQLICAFQKGNRNALNHLVSRNQNRIYAFILTKVKDRDLAKDILQDTLIKVVLSLRRGKYFEKGRFISWVIRIANNLIIDYFRKQNRLPKYEVAPGEDVFDCVRDCEISPEDTLINQQVVIKLRAILKTLPRDQRELIRLRVYCSMSFKDIALQTDVSINTALGRMRYAVKNIRKKVNLSDLEYSYD